MSRKLSVGLIGFELLVRRVDEAFIGPDGTPKYPTNSGRVPGTDVSKMLDRGTTYDCWGSVGSNNPQYGSYLGEPGASIGERAITPTRPDGYRLYTYVPRPGIPELPIIESKVLPWFGQPGGGTQFEFDVARAKELYVGHVDFQQMFNGDRLDLDYWFDISWSD